MNSTIVSVVALLWTFGTALVAMVFRARLPAHHLEGDSKSVVTVVLGLVATLTALVLGLLISSAHTAYVQQQLELQQLGVHLFQIDRVLAHFGPDASEERARLRRIVVADIVRIWPGDGVGGPTYPPLLAQQEAEELFYGIGRLSPKTDLQRFGQSRALELLASVGETRRLLVEQANGALSRPFLAVLFLWFTVLFFGFGLSARRNATVVGALFVGSLSVASAIFLILESNQPYSGWMQLSSAPLRAALAQLGR